MDATLMTLVDSTAGTLGETSAHCEQVTGVHTPYSSRQCRSRGRFFQLAKQICCNTLTMDRRGPDSLFARSSFPTLDAL